MAAKTSTVENDSSQKSQNSAESLNPTMSQISESVGDSKHCDGAVPSFSVTSQLSGTLKFTNKVGRQISAFPIIVDFRRLIQLTNKSSTATSIIPRTTNEELLHAVVGLYDVSLSDMTADVLYSTVCDKWAKTVVLIQDLNETIQELKERKNKKTSVPNTCEVMKENEIREKGEHSSVLEDVYEPEDSPESVFREVYSDTESEEEEEDSDDEDYSKGIHSFIQASARRRQVREESPTIEPDHVGIENRIVGAMTFEKKYIKHTEKVAHLTLLTVRRRYRRFGVGRYLMKQVLNSAIVGPYDAVVVHADNRAVDFFTQCGFSDDVVLNSRWSELAEQFTNCTLMCYMPGFSESVLSQESGKSSNNLKELEKEMKECKEKSLESYQCQVTFYMRLKQEIINLQNLTQSQSSVINELSKQSRQLLREQNNLDTNFVQSCRSDVLSFIYPEKYEDSPLAIEDKEDLDTAIVMRDLERRVKMLDMMRRYKLSYPSASNEPPSSPVIISDAYVRSEEEPYDHTLDAAMFYKITEEFKHAMRKDKELRENYEVTMITKACLSRKSDTDFWLCLAGLSDPCHCEELYFSASRETTQRLQIILKDGFSLKDFSHGDFGSGLYFAKYPSRAAQVAKSGLLILAEVAVGKIQTGASLNTNRESTDFGFDSIITPCRSLPGGEDDKLSEQYLVFNPSQARPICLISYESVKAKVLS